jgi:hypothetical protein
LARDERYPLPIVCFTRHHLRPDATTDIPRQLAAEGVAWISEARLASGERWLRACITHHETDVSDVDALVSALCRIAAEWLDRHLTLVSFADVSGPPPT